MSEKNEVMPIDQHPYVQGLAQIARNAVDRVIELEQASARDNIAFKQLLAQRDALRAALELALSSHNVMLLTDPPQEAWKVYGVEAKARAAIDAVAAGDTRAEPVEVPHRHEWFSTGGMEPGQMRCIHCGAWGRSAATLIDPRGSLGEPVV